MSSRVRSSGDMLGLVIATNYKIARTYGDKVKRSGGELELSEHEERLLVNARKLYHRYRLGDYRHTPRELGQLLELCRALISMHAINHAAGRDGDAEPIRFEVDLAGLTCTEGSAPKPGTFGQLLASRARGEW